MGMLQCAVVVAAFAVITEASPRPLPLTTNNGTTAIKQRVSANTPPVLPQSVTSPLPLTQVTNSATLTAATQRTLRTTATPQSSLPTTQSIVPQDSLQDFNRPHPCGHFPSPGECQAAFPRYYYNNDTSQCDCYLFGGCDEDVGSYQSLEECDEKCTPILKEEGPTCKLVFIDNFSLYEPSPTTSTPITRTQPSLIPHEQPNSASPSNETPSSGVPATDGKPVINMPFETSQAGASPVFPACNATNPTPTNTPPVNIGSIHDPQSITTSPLNRYPSSGSPDRAGNPVINRPSETNQPGAGHDSPTQTDHYPNGSNSEYYSYSNDYDSSSSQDENEGSLYNGYSNDYDSSSSHDEDEESPYYYD